jgi:conjugative transposon TraK protein
MEKKNVEGLSKAMNTITSSFGALKTVVLVTIIGAFAFCGFCVYYSFVQMKASQSRVYVLENGMSFSAREGNPAVTKSDEIRDQVKIFHTLFFNVPPDMDMIKKNMDKALAYADRSAYDYYQDLVESGFYKKLVGADAYQQIDVDSIAVDVTSYPYKAIAQCTQWITRGSNRSKYSLVTTCSLVDIPRSANNLHGLMIRKFTVIENKQLETVNITN